MIDMLRTTKTKVECSADTVRRTLLRVLVLFDALRKVAAHGLLSSDTLRHVTKIRVIREFVVRITSEQLRSVKITLERMYRAIFKGRWV